MTEVIALARRKGRSAEVGDGLNRWSATHVSDAARLYRLAFEKHDAGARYHATAEQGITFRSLAEAIGQRLDLPVTSLRPEHAEQHFGWLAAFTRMDMSATSTKTRERLGWQPSGPGLIAELHRIELGR